MAKKKVKRSPKKAGMAKAAPQSKLLPRIGYAVALLVIAYIAYSVWVYLGSVETTEEFLVCSDGECVKSFHIHAQINPVICGDLKWSPLEHGKLEEQHTHKERNVIHFHERLRVTPDTHEILDYSPLRLRNFMENMEPGFDGSCLFGTCEGDACPGSDTPGSFRIIVNGKERPERWDYIWKDGDDIEVIFG